MGGNLRAMCSLLGAERPTIPFFRRRGDFLMENDKEKKKEEGKRRGKREKETRKAKGKERMKGRKGKIGT